METHPSESRIEPQLGAVIRVYPDTWEVDVRLIHSSSAIIRRAKINGVYLPEVHSAERPSHAIVVWMDGYQQSPVALPLHNTIAPPAARKDYVYWSEHHGFRVTIKEPGHLGALRPDNQVGELEIRSLKGGRSLQIRIIEDAGVIRLDTPTTHVVLTDDDGSVAIACDGDLTAEAGGTIELTAPAITLNGAVTINGTLDVP